MTGPAHTSLFEYRQQEMDTAKRQDLVIPWRAAVGATCCPFHLVRQPRDGHCAPEAPQSSKQKEALEARKEWHTLSRRGGSGCVVRSLILARQAIGVLLPAVVCGPESRSGPSDQAFTVRETDVGWRSQGSEESAVDPSTRHTEARSTA